MARSTEVVPGEPSIAVEVLLAAFDIVVAAPPAAVAAAVLVALGAVSVVAAVGTPSD